MFWNIFFCVCSLFSTSWAVPNSIHSSSVPSPTSSQKSHSSSQKSDSSNSSHVILLAIAIGGSIILILACVLVHYFVRRYVNNKKDPQPTVIDLKKEFNSENSSVSGVQGVDMDRPVYSATATYSRQSYYPDNIQSMQERQAPYARERSVGYPDNIQDMQERQEPHVRERSLGDVAKWAQTVRMSAYAPNTDRRPPSRRSGRERRESIHPPGLTPGRDRRESIHPAGLTPGVRPSTALGWGRQSVIGEQIRFSQAGSPQDDFRISYFYDDVPPRPLPSVPGNHPDPYHARRSTYDWARQSMFDPPHTAPVVRSDGSF